MRRKFVFAIALALLVVCMSGCVNENEYSDTLSDRLREEIIQYCRGLHQEHYDKLGIELTFPDDDEDTVAGYQYYGTYNGYAILHLGGNTMAIGGETIDGRRFMWISGSGSGVFAFKNGKTYRLREIYESGDITEEDLDSILAKHKAYFEEVIGMDYEKFVEEHSKDK